MVSDNDVTLGEVARRLFQHVSPRDDALAGGAGRNYPPSRAMQSGNRTSGGYW